jgi:hypothetical protein
MLWNPCQSYGTIPLRPMDEHSDEDHRHGRRAEVFGVARRFECSQSRCCRDELLRSFVPLRTFVCASQTPRHAGCSPRTRYRSASPPLALRRHRGERGRSTATARRTHLAGDPRAAGRPCLRGRRARSSCRDLHADHGPEPASRGTAPRLPGERRCPPRASRSGLRQSRRSGRTCARLGSGLPPCVDAERPEGSAGPWLLRGAGIRAGAPGRLCRKASGNAVQLTDSRPSRPLHFGGVRGSTAACRPDPRFTLSQPGGQLER